MATSFLTRTAPVTGLVQFLHRALDLGSFRGRILAATLAVTALLTAAMGYQWRQSLQEARKLAVALLDSKAEQIEDNMEALREDAQWILARMAERPRVRELDAAACDDEMGAVSRIYPAMLLITLWRPDGELVCTSQAPSPGRRALQPHRPSFDKGLATDGLYVSNLFLGEITGKHLVTFTYPVKNFAGATVGLLSIPLRPEFLDGRLQRLNALPGGVAGIIDGNAVIVARSPNGSQWRGKFIGGSPLADASRSAAKGVVTTKGLDDIERVYAYMTLPGFGWNAYVGVEVDQLFGGFLRQLAQGLAMGLWTIALCLAYALYFTRRISRPLEHLVVVVDAVAAGQLSRRVAIDDRGEGGDCDEVRRLATHINHMLDALERLRESLGEGRRRLHTLSSRLLRAEEIERTRISRELHDQIGQELSALALDLAMLARRGEAHPETLERCISSVDRLLDEVRDITLILRPPLLDELGLVSAMRQHIARLVTPHGIQVRFEAQLDQARLGRDLEATCFRVVQEALTNILRHARARNVGITLRQEGDELAVEVRDDGQGFDVASALNAADAGSSFGVRNLLDRVELAGGILQIDSAPGGGTAISARFPLRPDQGADG